MTAFYSLRHNSAYRAGVPQIYEIVEGLFDNGPCLSCRAPVRFPAGDLLVKLGDSPVDHWPDVMACGDYPCFVVSSRFLSAMGACQIATVLGGGIDFVSPVPSGLSLLDSPKYYWLDGKNILLPRSILTAADLLVSPFARNVETGMRIWRLLTGAGASSRPHHWCLNMKSRWAWNFLQLICLLQRSSAPGVSWSALGRID